MRDIRDLMQSNPEWRGSNFGELAKQIRPLVDRDLTVVLVELEAMSNFGQATLKPKVSKFTGLNSWLY